jgi:hypothetical protein
MSERLIDAPRVAEIWYSGWLDGHLGGVPEELAAAWTPASFRKRAAERVRDTTVATVAGSAAGFVMVVFARHRGRSDTRRSWSAGSFSGSSPLGPDQKRGGR